MLDTHLVLLGVGSIASAGERMSNVVKVNVALYDMWWWWWWW
jgi:hypothetical protein